MANLRSNGTEVVRLEKRTACPDGEIFDSLVSIRSNGWVLTKSRMSGPTATGKWSNWKRRVLMARGRSFQDAVDYYTRYGWKIVSTEEATNLTELAEFFPDN